MKVVLRLENGVRAFALQPEQLSALRERFPAHEFVYTPSPEDFLAQLPSAQAALVWDFEADWYALAPALEFVATPAAGRERVAPDPTARVRTLHGAFHGKIMAESLLAMMLFFSRRLNVALRDRQSKRYERDQFSNTRRLLGQQAVIVGYGPLGRECAARLKALGLRVAGLKRNPNVDPKPADAVMPMSMFSRMLEQADHVVVTLPSDTGTDHLFDDSAFRSMRSSAYFYNLGRGNAVDERALVQALERGQIAGAFLDVFEREPLPQDSPLWSAPHLEFFPHASAISREYLDLWIDEIAHEFAVGPAHSP
ncbi:MAG TPA: D-2-hydroxyacid dehydrogenase [Polyangiaceae bacterium]|nr:D-2-hydroxyacid dehydrogenase [Polyangiaceae bacterium]